MNFFLKPIKTFQFFFTLPLWRHHELWSNGNFPGLAGPRATSAPKVNIRLKLFHLRLSSEQLEYDQDGRTRELPDHPGDASLVPLPDEMPGSLSLPQDSFTTTVAASPFPTSVVLMRQKSFLRSEDLSK
ncbi:hypothetical protein AVEN_41728-1 [Araneus ventricosus]|uniref:Uncharacterized protein n=1 Tax=Araneus ventricosus TaxID=182803 RepID=A0A4Y2ADF3_ARAVE|nr:hypothetical protein AVEN_41728-1 [Araneus ventricosus]